VASAPNDGIIHELETLMTYSDAYEATHHVVWSVLAIQHLVLHITYDPEAALSSELDQVKCRVAWTPSAPYMRNRQRLLATTMRGQSLKESTIVGVGGGDEDTSLGEEDDEIYHGENVKYEPQPNPTQSQ
jgi:hypothetical protein